jgi:hypothetical protein
VSECGGFREEGGVRERERSGVGIKKETMMCGKCVNFSLFLCFCCLCACV